MKKLFLILSLVASVVASAIGAPVRITGVVTSADDSEPLIGVTVQVKENRKRGTATDIDGRYTIEAEPGQTLLYSYVGYTPAERKVKGAGTIDIIMESSAETLQEFVAIGYGQIKKSDLTGAVSTVAGDKLSKTPASSLANALQGQAAGVSVNSLTGRPGASAEVRIRGLGTINGASPIYVVDGVITDDINFLSPNDIEHTEILKDASAAAIYGSRGANGVIIVTTRAGRKAQNARVSFDAYAGVQQRWRKLDVMNAKDFADTYLAINGNKSMRKIYDDPEKGFNQWLKIFQGLGASDFYPTIYDPKTNPTGFDYSKVDTDWQDVIFRNGMVQNYHLGIDGGDDRFTYAMSGSWFGQEGIIIGSDYERLTARLNTSYKAFPWLKIGENISFMASTARNTYESGDNSESAGASIISAAFAMAPWDPTHYPEGTVNRKGQDMGGKIAAGSNFKNVTSPLSMVEYNNPLSKKSRFVGNLFGELNPLEGLTFRSSYNFDFSVIKDRGFGEAYLVSSYDQREKNFLNRSIGTSYYWNVDNILTYARTLGEHDFSAMVGQTVEEYNWYSIGASGSSIINPVEKNWYLSQVTDDYSRPSDGVSRNRRMSFLSRLNYNYGGRYMATVNFRADGSSKFPEYSWGYFPSFALAWRLSKEQFMSSFADLDDLKIRFGWGRVGNDNIGNDAFVLNMFANGPTFVDYSFNGTLQSGAAVLTWINNGGHWENTEQLTAGVDFGFFNGKLSGSFDAFIRDTNDMLMSVNAPAHVGNRYAGMSNVGKVRNKGIELTLEHRYTVSDLFHYSISGNASWIDNKLVSLNGGSPIYTQYGQVQVVDQGYPLYYYWGYQYDGVYKSDEEALEYLSGYSAAEIPFHAGDAKYRDNNGNGVINDKDRVYLGSNLPTFNYGLNLGAWVGDFDLQVLFQGAADYKIYNQMRHRLESNGAQSVLSPIMKDAWTVDNPEGTIPNPKNSINYYVSDRFLEDGDYFRLKNLQLGYTLPAKVLKKAGINNCRFYIQGSNLFTITNYTGFDPEVAGGVDYGNFPQCRSYLFGVNLTY